MFTAQFLKIGTQCYIRTDTVVKVYVEHYEEDGIICVVASNGGDYEYARYPSVNEAIKALDSLMTQRNDSVLLDDLVIPQRLRSVLKRLSCVTLGDARRLDGKVLRGMNNIGIQSLADWEALVT